MYSINYSLRTKELFTIILTQTYPWINYPTSLSLFQSYAFRMLYTDFIDIYLFILPLTDFFFTDI